MRQLWKSWLCEGGATNLNASIDVTAEVWQWHGETVIHARLIFEKLKIADPTSSLGGWRRSRSWRHPKQLQSQHSCRCRRRPMTLRNWDICIWNLICPKWRPIIWNHDFLWLGAERPRFGDWDGIIPGALTDRTFGCVEHTFTHLQSYNYKNWDFLQIYPTTPPNVLQGSNHTLHSLVVATCYEPQSGAWWRPRYCTFLKYLTAVASSLAVTRCPLLQQFTCVCRQLFNMMMLSGSARTRGSLPSCAWHSLLDEPWMLFYCFMLGSARVEDKEREREREKESSLRQ